MTAQRRAEWTGASRPAAGSRLPRLVVIDYAEGVDPAALEAALDRRVRVLLLTRTRAGRTSDPPDVLEASASAALAGVLAAARHMPPSGWISVDLRDPRARARGHPLGAVRLLPELSADWL